jgi:uncharacterized protein (DUF736 family)
MLRASPHPRIASGWKSLAPVFRIVMDDNRIADDLKRFRIGSIGFSYLEIHCDSPIVGNGTISFGELGAEAFEQLNCN